MAKVDPTYPPLDTLQPVAGEVWIVGGPLIRFGPLGLKAPVPTRMTVIRLPAGLFVHSQTPLTPALNRGTNRIGAVRCLIALNYLHHWWLPEWRAAYPRTKAYLAPSVPKQAKAASTSP